MSHLKHYTPVPGFSQIFKPGEGELEHLWFGMMILSGGQTQTIAPEPGNEMAITILIGGLDANSSDGQEWKGLGGRKDVFEGPTDTLFLPKGTTVTLTATSDCEMVIVQAKSDFTGPVTLFAAKDAMIDHRGKPGWERDVLTYIPSNANVGRLILGEVYGEEGQWSTFPPHKHDVDNLPTESDLEEIYLFKIFPETGFAFQGLYAYDNPETLSQAYVVRHNDVTAIPRGYHPISPAPGHRTYCYWVLAGTGHSLKVTVEDNMRWLEPDFVIKS